MGRGSWIFFSYLAVWAFLLYGIGNATPYLRIDLRLNDFQSGLHASALAVGVLCAGVSADTIGRRLPSGGLLDIAVSALIAGLLCVALAPVFAVSLAGASLLGIGGGWLGTHVNVQLSRAGGGDSRKLMSQANAVAMIGSAAAPLAIGLAVTAFGAWRLALLLPIIPFVALTVSRPRSGTRAAAVRLPKAHLPRAYWFVWLLLVLCVSIEFSFVYWGSTIVAARTGLATSDATLLASLFVIGMFLGRAALGRGFGGASSPRRILSGGLLVVIAGAALVWASPWPAGGALGLFVAGLGVAGLFPIGISVAMAISPKARLEASARATLASGIAVLIAPSALGLLSDSVGVVSAWPVIVAVALCALGVLAVTPQAE